MKRKSLVLAAMFAMALFSNVAMAQVETTADLEGVYKLACDGGTDSYLGTWNSGLTCMVEVRAIDDATIEIVDFLASGAVAQATVNIDLETVRLPAQIVSENNLYIFDNYVTPHYNSISLAEANWMYDCFATIDGQLNGGFDDEKNFSFTGILAAGININKAGEFPPLVFQNIQLTYVSPLPATGVDRVDAGKAIAGERWFTLDGRQVLQPAGRDGQVYIVVRRMQDGTVKSSKVLN